MKRAFVVVAFLFAIIDIGAAAPPALNTEGGAALGTFLKAAIDRGDVPGAVVLVTGPDRVLYHEAFGKMSTAKALEMKKDTIFNIASMTKAVTSVGVMMLVEEGKLGLDDEVSKYLPQFKAPQVLSKVDVAAGTYETRPATRPITIRQLLTHTSGIGYSWSDPGLALVQKKTGAADLDLPLVNEPGAQWTYGASTRVLGMVIEKISGLTIDKYIEARILGPLGMKDTTYAVPSSKTARVVSRNQRTDGKIVEIPNPDPIPPTIRGDGGLYSTAADYGRFVQMILNQGQLGGVRILKEQTVREMSRNQTGNVKVRLQPTAEPLRSKPYPLGAGEDVWGLGFQIAAPAKPAANMRRPGSMNWAGINNTFYWIDPEKQIGVVVLMQILPFYDDAAIKILQGVEERVYQHVN
ncbi:MAG TPA: serine hydrolase domain-containing protein [Vicinamibacterales bacterium]|nr:serine hydrolase domain-containing protein [Vicinamibacterales bacterium]